jgi:ATP-binding cassette, subfamily B, bacterial MsbA
MQFSQRVNDQTMRRDVVRFLKILKPQTNRAIWAVLSMFVVVLLQLPLPLFSKYFIDTILPQKSMYLLNLSIGILAVTFIIREAANVFNEYLLAQFREIAIFSIKLKLFQHIQSLDLSFFKEHHSGYLTGRINSDTGNLHGLLADTASNFLRDFLTIIMGLVAIFIFSWKLAIVSLLLWPFFIFSILFYSPRLKKKSKEVQEHVARSSGIIQESLTGIYLVKSFLSEKFEARKLAASLRDLLKARMNLSLLSSVSNHVIALLGSSSSIILLWYGGYLVFRSEITLGMLMAFTSLLSYIFGPTHRLINLNASIQTSLGSLERIYELLDVPSEIKEEREDVKLKTISGKVAFEHISFSYDAKEETLADINITAEAGETVALVGKSGAGKTTICNLLMRFFEPQKGRILIDEIEVKRLSLKFIRQQIGIVPQDVFLFSGSIGDNIRAGNLHACSEDIINAAKLAQIHDFIMKLPDGYETEIGERGTKLSGGQRQRISLARVILKDPRIIILDEATSELDTETEALINTAIENLLRNRTTFIIAHRLSTIMKSNKIVFLKSGKIIGTGAHRELYESCPHYRHLFDLQFAQPSEQTEEEGCF